jgi:hypothetical protein
MNRIFLVCFFTLGITGLIISSCDFCENIRPYWVAEGVNIHLLSSFSGNELSEEEIYAEDTLMLTFSFSTKVIASSNISFLSGFIGNQAYAMKKCPEEGYKGSKYDIVSFTVTSSKEFAGIPVGEPINDLLLTEQGEPFSTSMINNELRDQGYLKSHFNALLTKPIETEEMYSFNCTIEFSNGQIFTSESLPVMW